MEGIVFQNAFCFASPKLSTFERYLTSLENAEGQDDCRMASGFRLPKENESFQLLVNTFRNPNKRDLAGGKEESIM